MLGSQNILNDLPPYQGNKRMLIEGAMNDDIIHSIHAEVPAAINQLKKVAKRFKGSSVKQTALNIFNFLRKEVTYIKDAEGEQVVKLPNALISKGGDCKSFALFTVAVLRNLGLPAILRYASYSGSTTPTHVYCLTLDENNRPIIIDAVWGAFNSQKSYTTKYDYIMNVYSLSGTDTPTLEQYTNRLQNILQKANESGNTIVAHLATLELRRIRNGENVETIGSLKSIALAIPRNAFLPLVYLNVRGLATKLSKIPDAKLKDQWEKKLGGKLDALKKSINAGKAKKPLLGMSGIAGPELAAALAAAAPIIASVAAFLKANGQSDTDVTALVNESGASNLSPDITASDAETGSGFKPSPMLIGGIAVAAFLVYKMFSKKK